MKLLLISNTLNALVQNSAYFQNYHAGYHSDINTNILNNFNPDGNTGKKLPLVLWALPAEGNAEQVKDLGGTLSVDMELYFYNLQDYGMDGDPSAMARTLITVLDELLSKATEFMHALKASRIGTIENWKWFTDANVHVDRLVCVGVTLSLKLPYSCTAYQSDPPLEPVDITTISTTVDQETVWEV